MLCMWVTFYDLFVSSTVLCCAVPYCAVLCCAVPHCVVPYCAVLYCVVLYSAVPYCAVLYCARPPASAEILRKYPGVMWCKLRDFH